MEIQVECQEASAGGSGLHVETSTSTLNPRASTRGLELQYDHVHLDSPSLKLNVEYLQ